MIVVGQTGDFLWMASNDVSVRAVSLVCLLGVGCIGVGSYFFYRLYTKLFPHTRLRRLSSAGSPASKLPVSSCGSPRPSASVRGAAKRRRIVRRPRTTSKQSFNGSFYSDEHTHRVSDSTRAEDCENCRDLLARVSLTTSDRCHTLRHQAHARHCHSECLQHSPQQSNETSLRCNDRASQDRHYCRCSISSRRIPSWSCANHQQISSSDTVHADHCFHDFQKPAVGSPTPGELTSGFCSQSISMEPALTSTDPICDNESYAPSNGGERTFLNSSNRSTPLVDRQLDVSNNNLSTQLRRRLPVHISNTDENCKGAAGDVQSLIEYDQFENINKRFHSTPEYVPRRSNDVSTIIFSGDNKLSEFSQRKPASGLKSQDFRGENLCANYSGKKLADRNAGEDDSDSSADGRRSPVIGRFQVGEDNSGDSRDDSDVFESEDLGRTTLSGMASLQTQIKRLHDDIGDMNERVVQLKSKEDPKTVVAKRYTLGATEALNQSYTVHESSQNVSSHGSPTAYDKSNTYRTRYNDDIAGSPTGRQLDWEYDEMDWGGRKLDEDDDLDSILMPGRRLFDDMERSSSSLEDSEQLTDSKCLAEGHVSVGPTLASQSSPSDSNVQPANDFYIDDDFNTENFSASTSPVEDDNIYASHNRHKNHYTGPVVTEKRDLRKTNNVPAGSSKLNNLSADKSTAELRTLNSTVAETRQCSINGNNTTNVVNNNFSINMKLNLPLISPTTVSPNLWNLWTPGRTVSKISSSSLARNSFAVDLYSGKASSTEECGMVATRWEVKNIEARCNIFEFMEKKLIDLTHPNLLQVTRQGYHQVNKMLNVTYIRPIRGDNYCMLRAVIFQVLVGNQPILKTLGTLQEMYNKLKVFDDSRYAFLKAWSFANRLPYAKGQVVETLAACIRCLYQQIEVMSVIERRDNREEYLSNLLNQAPELDLQLMEAVKLLMMLNAIRLHMQLSESKTTGNIGSGPNRIGSTPPMFIWMIFSSDQTPTLDALFLRRIDPIGDSLGLQQSELHLLGHTLGIKIEIIRPVQFGSDKFISHYPDEGADRFGKIYLIQENDNHCHVVIG